MKKKSEKKNEKWVEPNFKKWIQKKYDYKERKKGMN